LFGRQDIAKAEVPAVSLVGRMAHRLAFSPQRAKNLGILVTNHEGVEVLVVHIFSSVLAIITREQRLHVPLDEVARVCVKQSEYSVNVVCTCMSLQ
jgi:hypothetical protein